MHPRRLRKKKTKCWKNGTKKRLKSKRIPAMKTNCEMKGKLRNSERPETEWKKRLNKRRKQIKVEQKKKKRSPQ